MFCFFLLKDKALCLLHTFDKSCLLFTTFRFAAGNTDAIVPTRIVADEAIVDRFVFEAL